MRRNGMDFRLTEEQNMIRDMTRKFVDEVVEPQAEELERSGHTVLPSPVRALTLAPPKPRRYSMGMNGLSMAQSSSLPISD